MKKFLRSLVIFSSYPACLFFMVLAFPLRLLGRKPVVFLVQPAAAGSIGDEAMMVSAIAGIRKTGRKAMVLGNDDSWPAVLSDHDGVLDILGTTRSPKTLLDFYIALVRYRPEGLFVIGADVMDGYYSPDRTRMRLLLLWLASAFCSDVRLLGFSFNSSPPREVVGLMRRVSRRVAFFARDPVSGQRLQESGIRNSVSADLAFMLKPQLLENAEAVLAAEQWMTASKAAGRQVVALNVNFLHVNKLGAGYVQAMRQLGRDLVTAGYAVALVSHDLRMVADYSDFRAAREIFQGQEEHMYLVQENLHAAEIKYLARSLDFVITGRMHFAIAALGQTVPTLMFAYQGKQEGLAKHFDLDPDLIVLDPSQDEVVLKAKIDAALAVKDDIRQRIASHLPAVLALSERNCSR